ncbi:aminoglycoside adenylyltransferase domain-containing protein [Streptomyces pilosus]|uniref:aminoglycoside adenylyltransferase domain-containing protein n=1 Tax=Streptomyces pilosus TaxID=28893 RepID=UPI0027E48C4A|nr:aminoglycoside adenylyltransferase domain-containing protein [Streptomyces pilosus]
MTSKTAAADWALLRLPPAHRPVLEHAGQLYFHGSYSEERRRGALRAQMRPHVDHARRSWRPLSGP